MRPQASAGVVTPLVFGRRSYAGSHIGGIREIQEMLYFCAETSVPSTTSVQRPGVIAADQIIEAWERGGEPGSAEATWSHH